MMVMSSARSASVAVCGQTKTHLRDGGPSLSLNPKVFGFSKTKKQLQLSVKVPQSASVVQCAVLVPSPTRRLQTTWTQCVVVMCVIVSCVLSSNDRGKVIRNLSFQSSVTPGTVARVEPNIKWFGESLTSSLQGPD